MPPANGKVEEQLQWQPVFPLRCDKLLASGNSCSISAHIHLAITNTLRRSRAVFYKDLASCKLDSALKPRAISYLWDPLFILNWLLSFERTISECHFQSTQGLHFSVPFVSVKILINQDFLVNSILDYSGHFGKLYFNILFKMYCEKKVCFQWYFL